MSHQAPRVTIITPTFNHAPYIRACVESVLAQTEWRWEQIVIDDGSTDGTVQIAGLVSDPRILVVPLEHQGITSLSVSYNLALEMARGELVAVLEGDDFWPPDKLEWQLPAFNDPGVVLSWGQAAETDEHGRPVRLFPQSGFIRSMQGRSSGASLRALLNDNYIPSSTVICRRRALRAIGGFRQPVGLPNVDYPTWLSLAHLGSFAPVDHLLGYHRRHATQVTTVMHREVLRNQHWVTEFVQQMPVEERRAAGITPEYAQRLELRKRAELDARAGRAAQRDGRDALAAAHFRRAMRTGDSLTRIKAGAGLLAGWLGFNLEWAVFARQERRRRRDRELLAQVLKEGTDVCGR